MEKITKKQKSVLNYIEKFILANGYSPSYREIAEKFQVQVYAIQKVVEVLIKKGYLEKMEGVARGFRIIDRNTEQVNLKKNYALIPIYGKVAAGEPVFIDDNISGYISIEKNKKMNGNEFGLPVQGDSMIDKHIIDGDIIIYKKQNYAENGDVIVAIIDDEVTTKIFRKKGNDVYLQPANELYKPIRKPFEILGVMIGLQRGIGLVYGKD